MHILPMGVSPASCTGVQKAGSAKATSMPFGGNVPLRILRLQAASHGCSAGVSLFVRAVSELRKIFLNRLLVIGYQILVEVC